MSSLKNLNFSTTTTTIKSSWFFGCEQLEKKG